MNPLLHAAKEVCGFLSDQGWEYCIIGGLAVQIWGEPRSTLDADITVFAGLGDEEKYVDAILNRFEGRFPESRKFALQHRTVLIRASNGVDVDLTLGAFPFEAEVIRRAAPAEFAPGLEMVCCSPEDLFIMKIFAGRPRDLVDAETIAVRRPNLDTTYIFEQLGPLCEIKNAPELYEEAQRILKENQ